MKRGETLRTRRISDYIYLGANIRYLHDIQENSSVHGESQIVDSIDFLFRYLEDFDLQVTRRAAVELEIFRDELAETDPKHKLTSDEASKLKNIIDALRKTLFAEASGNVAFIVTDKRIDVNKLLSSVDALMAPDVFELLPIIAQYDFSEAGKCIAFERATAAAFHLLRGTEAVLRYFYCSFVRRDRVRNLLWGPMIEHLRKRRKKPPEVLLNNLDNVRRSFRNPTQHPEKIYDIEEVQDLFGLCIDVVNRMIKLI